LFTHRPPDVSDATVEAYIRPMVERAAFALSTNEAWALLACVALLGLLLVPFAASPPQSATGAGTTPSTAPDGRF
jgi:DHA2 family multidrug resistance protein